MKTLTKGKYVIATTKSWNIEEAKNFISKNPDLEVLLITNKGKLTYQKIEQFHPGYIFFPHWSWIIPKQIYKNYECVVFHMADLPFGRGGSPLQNLIERGISRTKISAIRAVKELDAGGIYLKRNLSLKGSADIIFKEAAKTIFGDIIPYIIKNQPNPTPQKGKVVVFSRRTPAQSSISNLNSLKKVYDYIRMLDAKGYPSAFVETSKLKMEFFNAKLHKQDVLANVRIKVKK